MNFFAISQNRITKSQNDQINSIKLTNLHEINTGITTIINIVMWRNQPTLEKNTTEKSASKVIFKA